MACLPQSVAAGPPFLTDDPEPTETGHWEIYAPLIEAAGRGADYEGAAGVELNYGALPDLQLTLGLPVQYAHDSTGWRSGAGDVKFSAKYRFFKNEAAGIQVALFPGVTLPTASNGMGNGRVSALLPIWVQKDAGPWSIFGGGGYAINPGAGNRDYWTGGIAVTRHFGERLLLGLEADRQGADTIDGHASTSLGLGGIYQMKAPFRLLASGGPTFEDHGGPAGFHAFLALGLDL
ncbi:transporter [Govanella unica]|uniref:Transporter n=1 Tax=Govanella unica TaxID=2975056 RepID=A0A9X3Z6H4_9PROT|nr:transporter [Govania unica]MDA5192934.1 transporter [Govania unica]